VYNSAELNRFYIRKIRLINFHNFTDDLIEVRDGGHLFILGDNGSGKTTLLDAVHYVLTGGECLELNSAARVTGNKTGGRRIQDIITRFNIDSGHKNPEGAVTYAALEIIGHNGKPFVAAIGMYVNSPTDNLNRWGILKSGSLEEIPFINDEVEPPRPRIGIEMKKAIGPSYCFLQIQSYQKTLADRFFGGWEQFLEFSRFLKIGKAYREIAAQTTDYHQLFKSLLPSPGTEKFEPVSESLKSLDASKGKVDNLKNKFRYIESLADLLNSIKYSKKSISVIDCLVSEFLIKEATTSTDLKKREREKLAGYIESINKTLADLQAEKTNLENLRDDYKQKDSSGLLRQEQELAVSIKSLSENLSAQESEMALLRETHNELLSQIEKISALLVSEAKKGFRDFNEISQDIPFSIGDLISLLNNFLHSENISEALNELKAIDFEPIRDLFSNAWNPMASEIINNEKIKKAAEEKVTECDKKIDNLLNSEEAVPKVDYFSETLEEFRKSMIAAKPLYRGLEWNPGTSPEEMNFIEEIIGEEILASLIIAEADLDKALDIIIKEDYSGIRIITDKKLNSSNIPVPQWIKKYFNLSKSDPASVKALIIELQSENEPEFDLSNDILSFRSHRRRLILREASLIGEKNRKLELKRQIAEMKSERQNWMESLSETEKTLSKLYLRKSSLEKFAALMRSFAPALKNKLKEYEDLNRELHYQNEKVASKEELMKQNADKLKADQLRITEIKNIISKEGISDLQEKINEVTGKITLLDKSITENISLRGKTEQKIEDVDEFISGNGEKIAKISAEFESKTNELKNKYSEIGNVSEYLNELKSLHKANSSGKCLALCDKFKQDSLVQRTELDSKIRDMTYSADFSFTYYDEGCMLLDRTGRQISEIIKQYELDIRETEEIINDDTKKLFTKIIMDDLVKFLKERISHIEQMEREINLILEKRMFGPNSYTMKIKPVESYKGFIRTIKNFSPFNEETKKELLNFIEDFKADIMATEFGEIPEMLDYRNWFGFEMLVKTRGSEGQVLNKHIKNIGSGGEQAVPNYLLILTIAHFIYQGSNIKLPVLLFDEAFYGIDSSRRNQLMGFAGDIGLQLFISTPDQDGVKEEVMYSTSLFIKKDKNYNILIQPLYWSNPDRNKQGTLGFESEPESIQLGEVR